MILGDTIRESWKQRLVSVVEKTFRLTSEFKGRLDHSTDVRIWWIWFYATSDVLERDDSASLGLSIAFQDSNHRCCTGAPNHEST